MKTVLKYNLAMGVTNLVLMPPNSEVLSVQEQRGTAVLYVLVRDDESNEKVVTRSFRVVMTGQDAQNVSREAFIGTVMLQGGDFVVHVFEVTP